MIEVYSMRIESLEKMKSNSANYRILSGLQRSEPSIPSTAKRTDRQ